MQITFLSALCVITIFIIPMKKVEGFSIDQTREENNSSTAFLKNQEGNKAANILGNKIHHETNGYEMDTSRERKITERDAILKMNGDNEGLPMQASYGIPFKQFLHTAFNIAKVAQTIVLSILDTMEHNSVHDHDANDNMDPDHHRLLRDTYHEISPRLSFNMTNAIEDGILFQAKFCPFTCDNNFSKTSHRCSALDPLCASCSCDDQCKEYGDCCDRLNKLALRNASKSDEAETPTTNYHCFQTEPDVAVYIIASCPRMSNSSASGKSGELSELHESVLVPSDENSDIRRNVIYKCDTCLNNSGDIHLVTSNTTGKIYCNKFCLECNEDRPKSNLDMEWNKKRICHTRESNGVKKDDMDQHRNGSEFDASPQTLKDHSIVTTDCQTTFEKPKEVSFRECDIRSTQYDIINTCAQNFTHELLTDIEHLCGAYESPVYANNKGYRNIFCFLCQGHLPGSCPVESQHDIGWPPVVRVTIRLLTDLSDNNNEDDDDQIEFITEIDPVHIETTCQDDQWFDPGENKCLVIHCVEGRNLSSIGEECQLVAEDNREDEIYVLKLQWFVLQDNNSSFKDGSDTDTGNLSIDHTRNIDSSVDSKDNDEKLYHLDPRQNDNRFLKAESKHFRPYRSSEIRKGDGVNKTGSEVYRSFSDEGQLIIPHKDYRQASKSSYFLYDISVSEGRKMSDIKTSSRSRHEPSRAVPDDRKKNDTLSITDGILAKTMLNFVSDKLKSMKRADYVLQIQNITETMQSYTDKTILSTLVSPTHIQSPPQLLVETVLYLTFSASENRQNFERSLLRNFVISKPFTVHGKTLQTELTLSDSSDVAFNETSSFYVRDDLTGKCCRKIASNQGSSKKQFVSTFLSKFLFLDKNDMKVIYFNSMSRCPHVIFNLSDFNMVKNDELFRNNSNMTLKRYQYLINNNLALVCVDTLNHFSVKSSKRTDLPIMIRLEYILTLVSLSLSIICLFLTFTTYCMFPMLRSMPGKNNMAVIFWLFLAQFLLLFSSVAQKHVVMCTIMGVLLHYSWLSMFLWTSVCSFHMFHVFVTQQAAPRCHQSHRFYLIRYSVISNLTSAIIVVLVIIVNLYRSDGQTSGYGGRVCYLNTTLLVGVAFVLPLSLILVVNLVLFSVTVFSISRIKEVKRHAGRERKNIHVYLRLSSLTGLCWILALMAEIPGLQFLRCVSVLVNGCQGVYLFLSYACNRRVSRMWCHLLKLRRPMFARKSTTSSQQPTLSSSV